MTTPPDTGAAAHMLSARWFDGLSSKPRPVLVVLRPDPKGPSLLLHPLSDSSGPGAEPIVFTYPQVGWPEAWSERRPQPRVVVDLRERGSLEIDAVADWYRAWAAAGARPGVAQRMQTRWPLLVGALVISAVGLGLFYRYGTPWAAAQLTRFVPIGWETSMSDNVLSQLDGGFLKPSKLPAERQAQLAARFDALVAHTSAAPKRYPSYQPQLKLEFRSGMPANAFALPGGKVVMTDAIVKLAAEKGMSDDALIGVLAHEIGHVVHRHGMRMVVEQGVLNLGLGLALGDVSGVVSTGATLLTSRAYSRNHEREADCYAIALMGQAALPTAPMGQLLLAIVRDTSHDEDEAKKPGKAQKPSSSASESAEPAEGAPSPKASAPSTDKAAQKAARPAWDWLSTHPDTERRATELEQGHAPHCPRD
ncbi:M48 family metallopeptidase [Acidovorax sp. DW039]|uniref:M48 family metallopeptidase n=1 Tax=Acidovorax sp. DW039 TaxID=3095606 RepID=UPI00308B9AD8|nr:M48 family metallopeptidase [Acidovorax sp. DW039]